MALISDLYKKSPVLLQNAAISLYGWYWQRRRFGGVFQQELNRFRSRNFLDEEHWKVYQEDALRDLLTHAFKKVPFYRDKYSRAGISVQDLAHWNLAQMGDLPYLEKDELREFGDNQLLAEGHGKGQFYASSGSTGTPTKIFYTPHFHQVWSAAYEVRIREWAGVSKDTPRGMIGGRRVVLDGDSKGPFYRYNIVEKQTYFSAYHIGPKTVENYLKGLIEGKVEYMTGYAASNYFLALEFKKAGIKPPPMKAVITSSEKLTSKMRDVFQEVYNCATFDSYSGVEACGLISETSDGFLVNSPDVGILEILDNQGNPVIPGQTGEVVSTGLLNFDQPLIRYRIGDTMTLAKVQTMNNGIQMPVIEEISGRIEDVVVGYDGRVMVRFHGVFIDIEGLLAGQVIQKRKDFLIIRIVVNDAFNRMESERTMKMKVKSQLGELMQIRFEYVDELPRTVAGKVRAVISELES